MDLLIKGMEMPEFGALNIFVLPDGKVLGEVSGQAPLRLNILGTAVPVPTPHGRLIDADEVTAQLQEMSEAVEDVYPLDEKERQLGIEKGLRDARRFIVELAPTVIEAEEEEE